MCFALFAPLFLMGCCVLFSWEGEQQIRCAGRGLQTMPWASGSSRVCFPDACASLNCSVYYSCSKGGRTVKLMEKKWQNCQALNASPQQCVLAKRSLPWIINVLFSSCLASSGGLREFPGAGWCWAAFFLPVPTAFFCLLPAHVQLGTMQAFSVLLVFGHKIPRKGM